MAAPNQGMSWSCDQTKELLDMYSRGCTCSSIASYFGRTPTAIQSRLCQQYFGKPPEKEGPAAQNMKRWTVREDTLLVSAHMQGARIHALMQAFGRSPKSIHLRLLEKMPRHLLQVCSDTELNGHSSELPKQSKSRSTTEEDKLFREQGMSLEEVARAVARTAADVSKRLGRMYFGAWGVADEVPWASSDDVRLLKEYAATKDVFAAADAVSRTANHVAFRLLQTLPRSRLTPLSAEQMKPMLQKHKELKHTGQKRSHAEIDDVGDSKADHAACTICMVAPKDLAIIPCGHTFCKACVLRTNMKTCAICRQTVQSTLRLFM